MLQEIRLNYQQNKMIDSPILSLIYYVLFYLKNSMFVKMPREREREGEGERSLCCLVDSVHIMVRCEAREDGEGGLIGLMALCALTLETLD